MKAKLISSLSFLLVLSGCAVGGGKLTMDRDKDFDITESDQIIVGMPVAELEKRLGKPSSEQLDDKGRTVWQYEAIALKTKNITAIVPFLAGAKTTTYPEGFELDVWVLEDKVAGVAKKIYLSDN